jgi:murein tripeptide amidase MpaA
LAGCGTPSTFRCRRRRWSANDVVAAIERLRQSAPDLIRIETIGMSVEGRSITHVALGRGRFRVLLWSQMHGDEPTATVALLDLLDYIRRHRDEPLVARLLDRLELHLVC